MKKLLALILTLVMLLALAACGQTNTPAPTEAPAPAETPAPTVTPAPTEAPAETPAPEPAEPAALPALGDEVEGFVVQDVREFPLIGATLVTFEHAKTGATYIRSTGTGTSSDAAP